MQARASTLVLPRIAPTQRVETGLTSFFIFQCNRIRKRRLSGRHHFPF